MLIKYKRLKIVKEEGKKIVYCIIFGDKMREGFCIDKILDS